MNRPTPLAPSEAGAVLPIRSESDVVLVRQAVRQWTTRLGFRLINQTKLITAASELARNALIHGGGGEARFEALADGPRKGLRLAFADRGPGIRDLALAMTDGYTTGNGLGMGLSGSKRLVDEFVVETVPGEGTTVTIAMWT